MATRAQLAARGRWRRRRNQFRNEPREKAMAVPASGPRKKAMAPPVRSRKWPRERVYTSGFWLSASKISEPGGGVRVVAARNPAVTATASPATSSTAADRRPARARAEEAGASDSLDIQQPRIRAKPGKPGAT